MVETKESQSDESQHGGGQHRLTLLIFLGLILGVITGSVINFSGLNEIDWVRNVFTDGIFLAGGQIFMRGLLLLTVPVVFFSLVTGTAGLGDLHKLGRIGGRTIGLYLITTAVAITMALCVALLVSPGQGLELEAEETFDANPPPSLVETVIHLFPSNPVQAMADGEMLQLIIFAILFGVALTLAGPPGNRILEVFRDLNEVVMRLVFLVIKVAPIGVFCLVARVFSEQGLQAIGALGWYFFTVFGVLMIHLFVTYPILLTTLAKVNPVRFFRKFFDVMFFAFSTASSNATIPVSLKVTRERLGVKNSVASFTVPLGASINMDGTAIMQGVATVFVAQAFGFELTLTQYLMVILTATLASIGTAGVPGVGTIMLAMVFTQVGLPLEGIGIILAVDRLLDMTRTAVNVTGDATISCVVARAENQFDEERFASDP